MGNSLFKLLLSVLYLLLQVLSMGGPSRVYAKAAKICSECIGLG